MRAKPCFSTHKPTQNTALPAAQPKMADAIFGLGLSHAPESSLVFVRKNGEMLKVTAEKNRNREWQPQHLTSILPKLLPYLALTKKVYFCSRCSR